MKVAVLADIHSNYSALKAVREDSSDCSSYILLGDIVGYNGQSQECIGMLYEEEFRKSILASVRGNHDYAVLTEDLRGFNTDHGKDAVMKVRNSMTNNDLKRLEKLTDIKLECSDLTSLLSVNHCLLKRDGDRIKYVNIYSHNFDQLVEGNPGKSIYLVGHSHLQFKHVDKYGRVLINPGSVGQSRSGVPKAHYAVLHIGGDDVEVEFRSIEYDIDEVVQSNLKLGVDMFISQRLYLGI